MKPTNTLKGLLIGVSILLVTSISAQVQSNNDPDDIISPPTPKFSIDKFVELVRDYFNDPENEFAGYQFIINKDGNLYYSEAGGNAIFAADNNGVDVPMTIYTRHHIASVSKFICTIVMANLLEDQNISWDESIEDYLPPSWVNQIAPQHLNPNSPCYITFEKLLKHQTCIDFGIGLGQSGCGGYPSTNQMLQWLSGDSLNTNPSIISAYRNPNFVLARILIAEIIAGNFLDENNPFYNNQTGDIFFALADSYIFNPLDLNPPLSISQLTNFLNTNPPRGHEYPFVPNNLNCGGSNSLGWDGNTGSNNIAGSSGMVLSSFDLAKVMAFFKHDNTGTIISASARDEILDNFHGLSTGESNFLPTVYGDAYSKGGSWGPGSSCPGRGFRSRIAIYPNGVELVAITNTDGSNPLSDAAREWDDAFNIDCRTFVHTTADATISGNVSMIDHPVTNGDPDKLLFVSHEFGTAGPNAVSPQGVWYDGDQWGVFNQDLSTMNKGMKYNVFVVDEDYDLAFKHTALINNIAGSTTVINHPLTNNNPDAKIIVTQNWQEIPGVYNNHHIGVWYFNGTWRIFNQDFAAMPEGATFNILVDHPNSTRHTVTNPFISLSNITNSELSNQNRDQMLFTTNNWGSFGPYNNDEVGTAFLNNTWFVYNEGATSLNTDVKIDLVAFEDCECCDDDEEPEFVDFNGNFCSACADTVECFEGYVPNLPPAVDNCSNATVTLESIIDLTYLDPPRFRINFKATDARGNSKTAYYYTTVTDDEPPTLEGVPDDMITNCTIPPPPEVVLYEDNCGTAELEFVEESEGSECSFKITRTFVVTDLAGNETVGSYCIYSGTYADQDNDGFNVLNDCDDLDPDIYPGAKEFCNGIDDDCDSIIDEFCDDCIPENFADAPDGLFVEQTLFSTQLKWNHYSDATDGCLISTQKIDEQGNDIGGPINFAITGPNKLAGDINGHDKSGAYAPDQEFIKYNQNTYPDGNTASWDPGAQIKWRVRCACIINEALPLPDRVFVNNLNLSPWSAWNTFTNLEILLVSPELINKSASVGDLEFEIYPNPTNDYFNIESKGMLDGNMDIIIYDALGKIVWRSAFFADSESVNYQIDTSEFGSGTFLVAIRNNDRITTKRLVVF